MSALERAEGEEASGGVSKFIRFLRIEHIN